ncbi:MAG: LysM domain-containing protein [Mycobacteriales bacterium]
MAILHKVSRGDKLESIARKYGHRDGKLIWAASDNRSVVSKRGKPENLQPGDVLAVPPNEKDAKELEKKVASLSKSRAGNQSLLAVLDNENERLEHRMAILDQLISGSRDSTTQLVGDVERNLRDMKTIATNADLAWTLTKIFKSLVRIANLCKKFMSGAIANLYDINKRAVKEVSTLASDPLKDQGVKAVSTLKQNSNSAVAIGGIIADAYDKIYSPSYWFYAVVQKQQAATWSKALASEVGDEIEERIRRVRNEGAKQVRMLQDRQAAFKTQLAETLRMRTECLSRLKTCEQGGARLR